MTRRLVILALAFSTAGFLQVHGGALAGRRGTGGGAASYVASSDWTASMVALWEFESPEGTGSTAIDSTGTAANNLTDTNNATRSATNVVEGSQALSLASASTQYLSCATATCTGLAPAGGDRTWGCLEVYRTATVTQHILNGQISPFGHLASILSNKLNCVVGGGSNKTATSTTSITATTHTSALCVWDDAADDELHTVINGATDGTATNADSWNSGALVIYRIGSSGTGQYFSGQLDECLEDDAAWDDSEAAHASNCSVDGKYCMCDGTDPTTYLACSTNADCRPSGSGNSTAICNAATCKGRGRAAQATNCSLAAPS